MNFEQSLKKLEEMIQKLESNDISLEDSISAYQEGTALLASCKKQLEQAQLLVTVADVPEEV